MLLAGFFTFSIAILTPNTFTKYKLYCIMKAITGCFAVKTRFSQPNALRQFFRRNIAKKRQ